MTQTNEQLDGQNNQPRTNPTTSSSQPSEESLQFLSSPPGIHQSPPPDPTQDLYAGDMITLSPQPTPVIQEEGTPGLPQRPQDDIDPRIAGLHAMFPDFDDSLLLSVLQSVSGNQDQAIDTLLGMSDPDYISQSPQPQGQQEPTQTELDEQLAHRLMLEEEQTAQHQWRPPQQGQVSQSYQPRRGATRSGADDVRRYDSTSTGGNVPQRDTMAEFQDGFNKIAETGKKTFSSIVSKVKAKMQEFDQGNGLSRQDTHPTWGQPSQAAWSGGQPHTNTTSLQSQYQQPYHDPNQQYQESYYDPNPRGESRILGSGYTAQSPPRPSGVNSSPTLIPNATYVAPNPATKPTPNSTSITSNSSTPTGPSTYSLPTTGMGTSPPPEFTQRLGDTPRLSSTGAGTPNGIDPTKLGLLPKRPVSLLREQNLSQQSRRDDSDDELEYMENPFEEKNR